MLKKFRSKNENSARVFTSLKDFSTTVIPIIVFLQIIYIAGLTFKDSAMNTINSLSTNLGLNILSFVDDPKSDDDGKKKIEASNDYFYEIIDYVNWNTEER